ncbi:Gfo/Idh/MocA family protein [uncultured Friedmanniella sp.]|uniref:Gfo/Idh/MocA family protein n=1 Tax=uncultured Friedmanniella sp. TaxID=335381 RepID=UPI0035CBF802
MSAFPDVLPVARTPDPRSAPSLRWGVLGTGWISERFVTSLQRHSSQRVVAVGSRSQASADSFAQRFGLERAYGTYDALVNDSGVDVVHIATPHVVHATCAVLALEAGKHALVEKPLAATAGEARVIAAAAAAAARFCMEAHWTTFLPKYDVLRQLLDARVLGQVLAVVADFGEAFPPQHNVFRPELAGGPMLDLGTYLVSLVVNVLGPKPEKVQAVSSTLGLGVPAQTAMIMRYGEQQAVLHATILTNTPSTATIAGTDASLTIDGPFPQPGGFTLTATAGGRSLRYEEERTAHDGGLHYQAAEVARRISNGELESPLRSLGLSIDTLAVMDEVRRVSQDGLVARAGGR